MGRIPEYSRQKFASSYVGGAQRDDSGVATTNAIQSVIQPMLKSELQKTAAVTELHIEQEANNILAQASLSAQKLAREKQTEYADNPEGYANAVQEALTQQNAVLAKTIPNDRVRIKTTEGMMQLQRAMIPSTVQWGVEQRANISAIAMRDTVETVVSACQNATTDQDVALNLQGLYSTIFPKTDTLSEEESRKALGLSFTEQQKIWDDASKRAVTSYLNNLVMTEPETLPSKLKSKDFQFFTVEKNDGTTVKVPITAELKDKASKLAQDYTFKKIADRDYARVIKSTGNSLDRFKAYSDGKVTLADLLTERDTMRVDKTASKEEKDDLDALIRVATRAKDNPANLDDFTQAKLLTQWDGLHKRIEKKRNKKTKMINSPQQFTTQLLELNTAILNAVDVGEITRKFANDMHDQLVVPLYKSIAAQKGPGFFGSSDPNSDAYRALYQKFEGVNLSGDDKAIAKVRAFGKYMDKVISSGAAGSPEQRKQFAEDAYNETIKVYFPEVAASLTSESVNSTASQKDGVDMVHTAPTSMKSEKRVKTNRPKVGDKKRKNGKWYIASAEGWVEQ